MITLTESPPRNSYLITGNTSRIHCVWTGTRAAAALAAAVTLVAIGFGVFFLTRTLVANDAREVPATSHETEPEVGNSTATPISTAEESPNFKCGGAVTTDAYGNPLGPLEPLVQGIHSAACRGDYASLLPYMENSFNSTPKEEVVAEWEREDHGSHILQVVAETFEVPPVGDQGGQYFCHPDGAVAVIARGTISRPGLWSAFDPTGQERPAACEAAE
ncbi:hypothetical protein JCM33774_46030 [Actinophytocola sp. KF-1]